MVTVTFIPEETYYTKNTLVFNTLNLKTGDIVEAGSELFQNVFSKTKGYVFINEAGGEICIKSGELFDITGLTLQPNETHRPFCSTRGVFITK